MSYAISTSAAPPKANNKLVKGVIGKNLETVTKALSEGADPNIYLKAWYRSLLVHAVMTDQDAIMQALIEAGADPWRPEETLANRYIFPGHTPKLRHHPQWGEICLQRLDERLRMEERIGTVGLQHLEAFGCNPLEYPLERRYRDLLDQRCSTALDKQDWWLAGLQSREPFAMIDAIERKGMPEVAWVIKTLEKNKVLQSATGILPFIERLSEKQRVRFFVGTESFPGALEALKSHLNMVRAVLWTFAINDPPTVAAMLHEDNLMTFLPLAMHQHANVSTTMLDLAKAQGIKVGEIVYPQRRHSLLPNKPSEDLGMGSLLDEHLNRHSRDVSVQVMRRLLQEGCQPTYQTMKLLAFHVCSGPAERKLSKLFETLWDKGADPEPPGERPIWDFLPRDPSTGVGRRLEAAYRQRRMEQVLQEPEPATGGRKPRL